MDAKTSEEKYPLQAWEPGRMGFRVITVCRCTILAYCDAAGERIDRGNVCGLYGGNICSYSEISSRVPIEKDENGCVLFRTPEFATTTPAKEQSRVTEQLKAKLAASRRKCRRLSRKADRLDGESTGMYSAIRAILNTLKRTDNE